MADDPDESLVYCLFGAFEKATLKAAQQHYYLVEFADDNSQRWASVCELMLRSQPLLVRPHLRQGGVRPGEHS